MFNFKAFFPAIPSVFTKYILFFSGLGVLLSLAGLLLEALFENRLTQVTDNLKLLGFLLVLVSLASYIVLLLFYSIIAFI